MFEAKKIPLFKVKLNTVDFYKNLTIIINCDVIDIGNQFEQLELIFCNFTINKPLFVNSWFLIFGSCVKVFGKYLTNNKTITIPYLIKASQFNFGANIIYSENDNLDVFCDIWEIYDKTLEKYYNQIFTEFDYSIKIMDLQYHGKFKQRNELYETIYFENLNVGSINILYLKYNIKLFGIIDFVKFTDYSMLLNKDAVKKLAMASGEDTIHDLNNITTYENLEMLEIESNSKIKNLPDLSSLSKLKRIYIENNSLEELPILPESLTLLSVKNNKIKSFHSIPKNLVYIDIRGNPINVCYEIFGRLKNICDPSAQASRADMTLYLSKNQIPTLQEYAIQHYMKNSYQYKKILESSNSLDYKKILPKTLRYLENHSLIERIANDCMLCPRCGKYVFIYIFINYKNGEYQCCC